MPYSALLTAGTAGRPGRPDGSSRFVAFAFAASEMVVEADMSGVITYAAGAFRSRLGAMPEQFLGRHLSELVDMSDQDALWAALLLLQERGRLLPCIIRLANAGRSEAVLAGLKLAPDRADSAICVTLGLPPFTTTPTLGITTRQRLLHAAQCRLGEPAPGHLALLEVKGYPLGGDTLASTLEQVSPQTLASVVAPGRYGLLSRNAAELASLVQLLEAALQRQGGQCEITSRRLSLDMEGLSRNQATRALKQALTIFAHDGAEGVDGAGFGGGLAAYVKDAMLQANSLRKAINQRDFTMLYQPIVELEGRGVHHYEALLRPDRALGSRSPQEFVTLIETAGLADELDMAVVAIVSEAISARGTSVAVNLSGQSVQDPAFRTRLLTLLGESRAVRDGKLLVEMTETAQLEAVEEAAETARSLRALGIRFCIDDFGAGSADIRMLRAIPTDIVKLDGSFVPGVLAGGRERAMATGMIEIARAAGSVVVAERIETEAEAEALGSIGAKLGQGWLFGRPAALPNPASAAPKPARPQKRRGVKESWG